MSLKRRQFLTFMGATAGSIALSPLACTNQNASNLPADSAATVATPNGVSFKPVKGPMPFDTLGIAPDQQSAEFAAYAVADDLVIPEGYTYDIIAAWGDPVGDSRFGYNNDYLSFVETAPNEGYLTVNFEYISGKTWMETYPTVIGQSLPFDEVKAIATTTEGEIDAFTLEDSDPLKAQIMQISKEGLLDQGLGVISIRRKADGQWERTFSAADRRITGISGLEDDRYLKVTGPAAAVFTKAEKMGYDDGLGDRIIGTFQNCAGGTTPWGTVLSAEENFQDQVYEPVMPDGSAASPSNQPFYIDDEFVDGRGNVFGLAGNKYGWMVEIDPANADDYGTKHSWLGRYRHEAVAVRAVANQPLAVYSGCDRRGGHLYKFVSSGTVTDPKSKGNSKLMAEGMLYAAKFNPDKTGTWIPLKADTPVNPDLPSAIAGGLITLPLRPDGGFFRAESDEVVQQYKSQYPTLGDLYVGNEVEKQGAILIDAHYAANAAGATTTARPEDTEVSADGTVFIAYTSGSPGGEGGPHNEIFVGPKGQTGYEHGWIMKLQEDDNNPGSMTFTWDMMAVGGEPAEGGLGFSNPDNLEIDAKGNVWMVTDMSTEKHNLAVPNRMDDSGQPVTESNLRGLFGNNSIWYLPTSGPNAGEAFMFGYGPMECEMCGPFLAPDQGTLFLAAQHPGETHGTRKDMASEKRQFAMKTTEGQLFTQEREVPIGSNWPTKGANEPPKPAVVAVRRLDGGALV
ncbi:MAG: alkaline phosphatase PhoX [Synechococcales bacterium]|nr:alkaline phosphatase PhoX [Synechococcales bacterium]